MVLAAWIECAPTHRASAPALHVLVHRQNMFALPAQHGSIVSAISRPQAGFVRFACVVAADACVEFVAAEMFDGNDVEGRVPMGALCQRRDRGAMDCGDC